jgi:hypothetical protein
MRATPTLPHELHFIHPNNNWRVKIYESLPSAIFSLAVLGANISLNTLLPKTLQLFSCHEMRHQKFYKFFPFF